MLVDTLNQRCTVLTAKLFALDERPHSFVVGALYA
jgi:hypothetical protein